MASSASEQMRVTKNAELLRIEKDSFHLKEGSSTEDALGWKDYILAHDADNRVKARIEYDERMALAKDPNAESDYFAFHYPYNWRFNKASYELDIATYIGWDKAVFKKNAAVKAYREGYADEDLRHSLVEADARSVYEGKIATADENYAAAEAKAALAFTRDVATNSADLSKTIAGISKTYVLAFNDETLTKVEDDANSQKSFVDAVTNTYVQSVGTWKGSTPTPWESYQYALAQAYTQSEQTRIAERRDYLIDVAQFTKEHADTEAADHVTYSDAVADAQKQRAEDLAAKQIASIDEIANLKKQKAQERADAIKTHDKAILEANANYEKKLALEEQLHRDELYKWPYHSPAIGNYYGELGTVWQRQKWYEAERAMSYSSPGYTAWNEAYAQQADLRELRYERDTAGVESNRVEDAMSNRDFNKNVAAARAAWTILTSSHKVTLAGSLKTQETELAEAIRDKSLELLDDLADVRIAAEQTIATAEKTLSDANIQGDFALAMDIAGKDRELRTALGVSDSALRVAQSAAGENYAVALHQAHADQLESIKNSATGVSLILATYQWQMAEAALASVESHRTAESSYQAALTTAQNDEMSRLNGAESTHQLTVGGANAGYDIASARATIDNSTSSTVASLQSERDIAKAAAQLTSDNAVAEADYRHKLALAERDKVDGLATSDKTWVNERADAQWAYDSIPRHYNYPYIYNTDSVDTTTRDAAIATANSAHTTRNEHLGQQYDLDKATATHSRATALGDALVANATALGDAGIALGTKLNTADTAYQAAITAAAQSQATAVASAQTTLDTALASSARLTQVATGNASVAREQSLGTASVQFATATATAQANYFRDDAEHAVDTLYAGFGGQPLSNFTVTELHPYAAALARRDWFDAMASTAGGDSTFITYATALAQAQATYNNSLATQQQDRSLAEMDASAALAAQLAGFAATRDSQNLQSQQTYDTQLTTLQNTRRGSLYAADKARLIAYAQADNGEAVDKALADKTYYQAIVAGQVDPEELDLEELGDTRTEQTAQATKTATIARADADLVWITSASSAEGGYALSEAEQTKTLTTAVVGHQKTYALAAADAQKTATTSATTRINSGDTASVNAQNTRDVSLANAWVALKSAGYAAQADAAASFVTTLSGLPWAYYVLAHSQATEDWWNDVSDDYVSSVTSTNTQRVNTQTAINTARTDADTTLGAALKTRETAAANARATRHTQAATETFDYRSAMINANVAYQFGAASAQRDLLADKAHVKFREALGDSSGDLTTLQEDAQDDYDAAMRTARRTLGTAQADAHGDYRTDAASHDSTYATSMFGSESTYATANSTAAVAMATSRANAIYNLAVNTATNGSNYLKASADARFSKLSTLTSNYTQPEDISPWAAKGADAADAERDAIYEEANSQVTDATEKADAARDNAIAAAAGRALVETAQIVGPVTLHVALTTAHVVWANAKEIADNRLASVGMFKPTVPDSPTLSDLSGRAKLSDASNEHAFIANNPLREPYSNLLNGTFIPSQTSPISQPASLEYSSSLLLEAVQYPTDPHQEDAAYIYDLQRNIWGAAAQVFSQLGKLPTNPQDVATEAGKRIAEWNQFLAQTSFSGVDSTLDFFDGDIDVDSDVGDGPNAIPIASGGSLFTRVTGRFFTADGLIRPEAIQEYVVGVGEGLRDGLFGTGEMIAGAFNFGVRSVKYLAFSGPGGGQLARYATMQVFGWDPIAEEEAAVNAAAQQAMQGAVYLYNNGDKLAYETVLKIDAVRQKLEKMYTQLTGFISKHGDNLVQAIVNRDMPAIMRIQQDFPPELQSALQAAIQVTDMLVTAAADQITPKNMGYIAGQILYEVAEDSAVSFAMGAATVFTAGAASSATPALIAAKVAKITNMLRKIADKMQVSEKVLSQIMKRLDDVFNLGADVTKVFKNSDTIADVGEQAAKRIEDAVPRRGLPIIQGCFAAGTLVWVSALPELDFYSSITAEVIDEIHGLPSIACQTLETTETTCPIEDVPLGARVSARNPRREDYDDSLPEPDEATWRMIRMEVAHRDGGTVEIEWLRPEAWIEAHGLYLGARLATRLTEIDVQSEAIVTALEPCPPIAEGEGAVVTGRFVTRPVAGVVRVQFLNGTELIGTAQHPVWSADRYDWVGLSELQPGEQVRTHAGLLMTACVEVLATPQTVYNIEVHGEHVYEVTESGILVHNQTDCREEYFRLKALAEQHKLDQKDLERFAQLKQSIEPDLSVASAADERNYIFRGDDNYNGGPVGRPLGEMADLADIQTFADHVLRKESSLSSRFTSFSTETRVTKKFTSASDLRYVSKAAMEALRELEAKGIIKIHTAETVYAAMKNGPNKLRKEAAAVRDAMRRNGEILIEGQIPDSVLKMLK